MKGSIVASTLGLIGVVAVVLLSHRTPQGSNTDATIRKLREEIERLKEQNKLLASEFHTREDRPSEYTHHTKEPRYNSQEGGSSLANGHITANNLTNKTNTTVPVLVDFIRRSTHVCFGRTYNDDYWIENTCLYNNLIYDPATDVFTYITASPAEATAVKSSGDLVRCVPVLCNAGNATTVSNNAQ